MVTSHQQGHDDRTKFAAKACVLLVVMLAAVLRFVALDSIPPAINQDEAGHAFQAYCVLKTGQDQFEVRWPLFFRSFGEYVAAPAIYAKIPGQALFGMTAWSTRLPHALLGTLNVWFIYLLIRRIYGYRSAILAALLLAVSPWAVHLSRLAFEVSLCPPLVTLGLYLIARCTIAGHDSRHLNEKQVPARPNVRHKKNKPKGNDTRPPLARSSSDHAWLWPHLLGLAAAGCLLGTALWTYNAYRVVVPLLMFGGALLYASHIREAIRQPRGRLQCGMFLIGFAIAVSPFVYASIRYPEQAWCHATGESILGGEFSLGQIIANLVRGYAMHLSPKFLFLSGDPYRVQSLPNYGQLHYYAIVLLPLGLYRVLRRRKTERFGLFVLWWMIIAPLPAALTPLEAGHCLRAAGVLPAYQILEALGLDMLVGMAKGRSASAYKGVIATTSAVFLLNVGYYLYLFGIVYPASSYRAFQAEWAPVVREVQKLAPQYDAILLTNRGTNQLGMIYLFWSGIEPERYFKMHRSIDHKGYWDVTIQLGKVVFVPSDFVEKLISHLPPNPKILIAERPGIKVPGRELKRFDYPDGQPAIILYDVQPQ